MIRLLLLLLSTVGLLSSAVYLILALKAAAGFKRSVRRQSPRDGRWPFVSVLKPLHGLEPMLEQNLESFFRQDYPGFEIIFGARHPDDPALKIVQTLARKYPQVGTQIVASGEPEYPNAKVFALEKMGSVATGTFLVITDSDVC